MEREGGGRKGRRWDFRKWFKLKHKNPLYYLIFQFVGSANWHMLYYDTLCVSVLWADTVSSSDYGYRLVHLSEQKSHKRGDQ